MNWPTPAGRVVIAGGSGFLGINLAHHLAAKGCEVVVLSRHEPAAQGNWTWVPWDARTVGDWAQQLEGAAAVVNLAGRSVDCIKTPDHRDQMLRSRVEATRAVGRALQNVQRPPTVWVQMSTAHIYGDPPSVVCDEDAAFGYGLAPTIGQAWEQTHAQHLLPNMRSVVLRTSFVLGRDGGAAAPGETGALGAGR